MNAMDVEPTTEPPAVPGVGDVLVVEGVRKTFEAENAPVRALRGANLRVPAGDFVALMGPSGCGKSTLLNLVAGLDVADEGTISVGGELVTGRTEDELSLIRREHIGIVFQFFNLLESMTALENVALPAIIAGTKRRPAESRDTVLRVGPLELDLIERTVRRGERGIDLLPREFRLLEYMMRRKDQMLTRAMLLEEVWNYKFVPQTNLVDVHMGRLRRKVDEPSEPPMIHNVRGMGFILRAPA